MTTTISAVICTLNRQVYVEKAVRSLVQQTLPTDEYEVLVIDNGSTDGTRETIARLMEEVPNLRYVHEPELGLSNARNRGAREAAGEIVAFLDDDAVAGPCWLEAIRSAFACGPHVQAVGGPVELIWPTVRPAWVPAALEGHFSRYDLGAERREIAFPKYPHGCNMALRRDTLLRIGGFAPNLGRRGDNLISNEEQELFERLHLDGGTVLFEPEAGVRHRVLEDRVSRRWLLRRAFAGGRSQVLVDRLSPARHGRRYWLGRSVGSVGTAVFRGKLSLVRGVLQRDQASIVQSMSGTAYWLGCAVESFRSARAAKG